MDLYGLAQRRDLDHGDAISYEPHEANGLRHMAVDPLLIATAVRVATLLLAHLVLRRTERGEDHAVVHPHQNLVSGDGVFQHGRECVCVGLLGRLHPEVDERFEQRLDLWRGYFRNAALKDKSDAGARCNLSSIRSYWIVIYLDVAQETMFRVGSAIEVQDDAISLELERRDDNPVAGGCGLSLLVDQFSVLCGAWSELSIRLKRNAGADWEGRDGRSPARLPDCELVRGGRVH